MIEIINLKKTFRSKNASVTALDDVSLTVADGEIFGIIGLSGAGKSTLVRCINLLEKPDSGQVVVDGQDLTKVKDKELRKIRQNIGMIFQGFNLLEQTNVINNVCFPLKLAGVKKAEAKKRATELLALVGLEDKLRSYPSQLSGGQKQRVAIARALATNPKYLLCDEATSALDPATTSSILELLQTINKLLGVTIVIITHEMSVIEKICHRVAVLDNSKIVEMGSVADIFTNPQSDMAKGLVLPNGEKYDAHGKENVLKLTFNGESSSEPLISGLIKDCDVIANILFADIREINEKNYGRMIISVPTKDDLEKTAKWLDAHNIHYSKKEAEGDVKFIKLIEKSLSEGGVK